VIELIFYPILPFVAFPPLALVVAGAFGWALWRRRGAPIAGRLGIIIAVAAWLAFGAYESYMYVWSQSVIAPIRVDLLLLAPLLYVLTIPGLIQAFLQRRVNRSDRS